LEITRSSLCSRITHHASRQIKDGLARLLQGTTIVCAALFGVASFAAPPTLEHLYPAGAARGSTNVVTLSGKLDPWPPRVWVEASGVSFDAQTNKGKFRVTVAADASPGPTLVRLFNDDGASEPRCFVVGAGREFGDVEPNNHFAKPQAVGDLPVTINGRLDKNGDVDSFIVPLRAGQWVEARADAYTLMSKLDAVLRLVTTNGVQLAWNHDSATLDPRLVWRATCDQTAVLQLFGFKYPADADVRLTGGDGCVYRLHLGAGSDQPEDLCAPPKQAGPSTSSKNAPHPPYGHPLPLGGGEGWGEGAAGSERAIHGDSLETAPTLELPATVNARLDSASDGHWFRFQATAGEFIEARVVAAATGSPLDAWLKITDASGQQLVRNDDSDGTRDPRLEWKVSTNGTYGLAVGSLTHRAGSDGHYRLELRSAKPDWEAVVSASAFALAPGETNTAKLRLKRRFDHTNELTAAFRDLPPGVTATTTNISAKLTEASLALVAATNAAPFNGRIRLFLTDPTTTQERAVPVEFTGRTEDNGVPGGYTRLLIERSEQLWLTVRPKPSVAAKEKN
jgi:hypothetical protein